MTYVLVMSAALAIGGVPTALSAGAITWLFQRRLGARRSVARSLRAILLVVLVELRGGTSVLGALTRAAETFPHDAELQKVVRLASVVGLTSAVDSASGELQGLIAQLARSSMSGAPAADMVRSMLEAEISRERSRRIERARSLPIRLMIPVALLVLPGLVLLLYAPSLLQMWQDLTSPFL